MIDGLNGLNRKFIKVIVFSLICLLFILCISFLAIPKLTDAYAAELTYNLYDTEFNYFKPSLFGGGMVENWSYSSFNPFELVMRKSGSDYSELNSYTWQFRNKSNSSIVYNGSKTVSGVSYSGNNYPKLAGEYEIILSASGDSTVIDTIILYGYARIVKNPTRSFSIVYDGYDYYNMSNPTISSNVNYQPQSISINDCYSIAGIVDGEGGLDPTKSYVIDFDWSEYISEVIGSNEYDCYLYLRANGQRVNYFRFSESELDTSGSILQFRIDKRPLLVQGVQKDSNGNYSSGIISVMNEKRYDGTSYARASLYANGQGHDKYDYLLTATKTSDAHSGLLSFDYIEIFSTFDNNPLFKFANVDSGYNSHYFIVQSGMEVPSSEISAFDNDGNVIYDKQIRIYCELHNFYSYYMGNYSLTFDGQTISSYVSFTDVGAILPSELVVSANPVIYQYGINLSSLTFEFATGGGGNTDNISVSYDGNLSGETISLINSGQSPTSGICIMIKFGREYRPQVDSPSDIIFRGKTSYGADIELVDYYNEFPQVMTLYYYPVIYYNTHQLPQDSIRKIYICGNLDLRFVSNTFRVDKKQLTYPEGVVVQSNKVYDGLLQASYSGFDEHSFDNQWVGDDGDYIEARIKPVFNNERAGVDKVITITYVLMLKEGAPSSMMSLLDRYIQPQAQTMAGRIDRREIEYSFDMSNAVAKPNGQPFTDPFLFPVDKILTFEKPFGVPLMEISDLIFGDYEYDAQGNVVYQNTYRLVRSTYEDEHGNIVPHRDFYGNIIYVEDTSSYVSLPKVTNGFIDIERPDLYVENSILVGIYNKLIDWSFYGVPVFEGGALKKLIVSHYDPVTKEVVIIDETTNGAVKYSTINENTPATGEPGIRIKLSSEAYTALSNYVLVAKGVDNEAYFKITKRAPSWSVASEQEYTYSGKQHSSMLDHIFLIEPEREDYDTDEEFELAYGEYLYIINNFEEIIKVNLNSHDDYLEIIGTGGMGINIEVFEYALPGTSLFLPISEYTGQHEIIEDDILLIKYAGTYKIKISLPETSAFNASEEKEITLEILRRDLIVFISDSKRYYGEPNPDLSGANIVEKQDPYDASSWGWMLYDENYINYMSTILYRGFIDGENPNDIKFGSFIHCDLIYEADIDSWPGMHMITANNGYAFNYIFRTNIPGFLTIEMVQAQIILEQDEVTVKYDYTVDAWRVHEIIDGEDGPTYIYHYTADDGTNDSVRVTVVGYIPISEESYDFSIHFQYLLDENNDIVYDIQGRPIVDLFHPKVVFNNGKWVPYESGLEGEVRDCTPPPERISAKYVGQYLFQITATPMQFLPPTPQHVKFTVDYADTIVKVEDEVIEELYNVGISFRINEGQYPTEEDYFYTNNEEIDVFIKLERSETPFDSASYQLIYNYRLYDYSRFDTLINDAGYYKVTFLLEYSEEKIRNHHLPDETEYSLYIHIVKRQIIFQFGIQPGMEEWSYRGTPYGILNMAEYTYEDLGITYSSYPEIAFEDIMVEIFRVVYNTQGGIIDYIQVPHAINAGSYRFRAKASSANVENYVDSEWIEQIFTIDKAIVTAGVEGREILPEDMHLFPDQLTYPLSKIYGEEIIADRYVITYEGWQNGEDPEHEDSSRRPEGFNLDAVSINWNGIDNWAMDSGDTYYIRAQGASSLNYDFEYENVRFVIKKKKGEVLVNEEYIHYPYTGTEHTGLRTFRALVPPPTIDTATMDYAFALNHDPMLVSFYITLTAKLVYNPQTQDYDRVTNINECVNVGIYIFTISASEGRNHTAVPEQEYQYEIVKAELKAIIEHEGIDYQITYGDEYPIFTLVYEGFVGKDALIYENALENIPFYEFANNEWKQVRGIETVEVFHPGIVIPQNAIDVGNYDIGLSGGSADNYYINVENIAVLYIIPKNIIVEASGVYVEKKYDKTVDADNAVNETHYVFTGIIQHPLKDRVDVVRLTFSAEFDSYEVGDRTVLVQELTIDNENYFLSTVSFICNRARITKASPTVKIRSAEFNYDGNNKQLIVNITGVGDELVNYILEYEGKGITKYVKTIVPPRYAGTYKVTVTVDDANYEIATWEAEMRILKAHVYISFGGDMLQTYGSVEGLKAYAYGVDGYELDLTETIIYYDANDQVVDDIKRADSGEYTAKAFYRETQNYLAATAEERGLLIRPKEVPITFINTTVYDYDGRMKHQRATFNNITGELQNTLIKYALLGENGEQEFINVGEDSEINSLIAPKDVGRYIAYAVAPKNYKLVSEQLESQFEILSVDILVKVENVTIKKGAYPSFSYHVTGIVAGEDINSLDIKPSVGYYNEEIGEFVESMPNEVGEYRIMPYGAKDRNYNISYAEGRLTINAVELIAHTSYTEGIRLFGSFSPDASLTVKLIQAGSYSRANLGFEVFKMNNAQYKTHTLTDIYEISVNGSISEGDMITVRLLLPPQDRGMSSYSIAHIKSDGTVDSIIDANITADGYLEFSVRELGAFSIIKEESSTTPQYTIYLVIIGAIIILLLAVVIIKKKA